MKNISNGWSNLGLQLKLQILIQGFLILILVPAQLWLSSKIEMRSLHAAEDRTTIVADGVINSLNTLMSTEVNGKDVISDEKARALFINKMGVSDGLKELRVVRGKGLTQNIDVVVEHRADDYLFTFEHFEQLFDRGKFRVFFKAYDVPVLGCHKPGTYLLQA